MNPSQPQEVQWHLEQAPPGGSFLVLNLGTNTVGLGSSCFFQSLPPSAIRSDHPVKVRPSEAPSPAADVPDQNVVEKVSAVADDRGGSGDSTDSSEETDVDPDWEPESNGSSVCRRPATRSGQRGLGAKPSEKAPIAGHNANASTSLEENPPGPFEPRQDGLPQSSDGGENAVVSSMEDPPTYIVNLLRFYSWTVTFHGGHEAVYTSPHGVMYHSLSKAFETFLHDSSKGEEEEISSARTLDGGGMGAPDLNHPTGLSIQDVVKEPLKRTRGRKKKDDAAIAIAALAIPQGEVKESSLAQTLDGGGMGAPDLNHPTCPSTQDVVKEPLKGTRGRKKKGDAPIAIAAPEEKESSSAQTLDGGRMAPPDLNHPTGPSTQDVVKETLKGKRGRKKKGDAPIAIAAPVIPQGEEKESSLAQTLDGGGMGAPDFNHPTGPSTQDFVKEPLKMKTGRKKKNDATIAIAAPVIPQGSNESQLAAGVQEISEKDGRRSLALPGETVSPSKEVSQMSVTPRVTGQCSNNSKNLHVQLPGPRRSARLSGRHTFYGGDFDSEDEASLYSPETDEKRPASLTSDDANKVCDEKSEGCMEREIPGSKKLDCSSKIIAEKNQSCSSAMHEDDATLELRRSGQESEEHFSVNMEINLERDCETNFVDSSDILDTNVVKTSEGKMSNSAPQMLNIAHEKPKSCNKVDHLMMMETEKLDNNSVLPVVNAQNDSTEVKRYMDLNMNSDETGIEMGIDTCFLNSSIPAVNSLTSESNEKPNGSASEVETTKGGARAPDDVFIKDTLAEEVVCDMSRAQTKPKSNMPKKTVTGRTQKKYTKKCLQQGYNLKVPVSLMCTPLSASKRKSAYAGYSNGKGKKRLCETIKDDQHKEIPSQRKLTALSWLIDAGILSENEMLVHKVKKDGTYHFRGLATRDGICCHCCKKIMTLSEFEHHAGSHLSQPWYNICLESGKSLMQCQTEAWEKEKKLRRVDLHIVGFDCIDPSDDTCGVCADGGNLICCDSCPSTFHQDCIMLKDFPEGRWHCPSCICTFCLAVEGGSDRVNQTLSLFTCQQCYRKYHWECTRDSGQHENLAESLLFCGKNCREVDAGLFGLLGVVNKIEEGFSWTLLKRLDEHEELNSDKKILFMMECNRKLSMALSVLNECFMPLVDLKTGVDLISHAVYNCGSNFRRLNYAGFYTTILEKDEEIISVASLRFHGRDLAEMPFIGTRPMHQRQGMYHRLLKAIEDLLSSLHVKKLIVPATPELLETWTTFFSFKHLAQSDKEEIKNFSLLVLPRTCLLQKSIPPKGKDCGENDPAGVAADVGKVAPALQDLQSHLGKQTNSGGCVTGGHSLPSRWDFESGGDRDKHAAQREDGTCSPVADACGSALRLGSSVLVSEISPPAQSPPAPYRSGVSASGRATCARFLSFDDAPGRGSGCREATGVVGAAVAARSHGTGMAENADGDGVFPAGYLSAFRWTPS